MLLSLPVLRADATLRVSDNEVRLMADPLEKIKRRAEFDGNPQADPSAYPTINFKLKVPQFVTKLRLMPVHADNGVVPGDIYKLLHWENGKWNEVSEQKAASYDHIPCEAVLGDLYWL